MKEVWKVLAVDVRVLSFKLSACRPDPVLQNQSVVLWPVLLPRDPSAVNRDEEYS